MTSNLELDSNQEYFRTGLENSSAESMLMMDFMKIVRNANPRRSLPRERRLHRRAMLYWEGLKREHELPLLETFNFFELEDRAGHGFLLDLRDTAEPVVIQAGDVLRDEGDLADVPVKLDDVPSTSLVGQFGRQWKLVLSQREPAVSEYDFVTAAGYHVYCRGVLLPLSSDGSAIDHVYGVISWKSEKVQGADS